VRERKENADAREVADKRLREVLLSDYDPIKVGMIQDFLVDHLGYRDPVTIADAVLRMVYESRKTGTASTLTDKMLQFVTAEKGVR